MVEMLIKAIENLGFEDMCECCHDKDCSTCLYNDDNLKALLRELKELTRGSHDRQTN